MDTVKSLYAMACKQYNKSQPHYDTCCALFMAAHNKLFSEALYSPYGLFIGKPIVSYNVFTFHTQNAKVVSRPVRPDIYIADPNDLSQFHDEFLQLLYRAPTTWNEQEITLANRVVYTAVMNVACCYDLWQRSSRKTPGTFFEILMAGLLQCMLPNAAFSKHIPLNLLLHDAEVTEGTITNPDQVEDADEDDATGVSTDLVIGIPNQHGGVVIPLKITTRERIVQPFAHQRILDSAFGEGQFKSLLVCISETQLDDKTRSVKQVCVPGTVKLFQKYLAKLGGIYYCDIPQRYAKADMQRIVPVRSVGQFFEDIAKLLDVLKSRKS